MKITRYRAPQGPQAATQPGSHGRVLLNRLGLASKRALDRAEARALARAQEAYYGQLTPQTRITASLLKRMHRDWLKEIYEWAGKYRWVELEKDGFRRCDGGSGGLLAPAYGFSGRENKKRRAEYLTAVKRGYVQD